MKKQKKLSHGTFDINNIDGEYKKVCSIKSFLCQKFNVFFVGASFLVSSAVLRGTITAINDVTIIIFIIIIVIITIIIFVAAIKNIKHQQLQLQ